MDSRKVVSREDWNRERIALLEREKAITLELDELSRRRRALPWVRIEKDYSFRSARGVSSFADLFGGRSQLVVYHFMFASDWDEGCKVCSLWTDGLQGAIPHLEQRDVSFVTVSTAAWERLEAFRGRMGWQHDWYSAEGSDFNRDFHVSYSSEEIEAGETFYNYRTGNHYGPEGPGLSVFIRDTAGDIFHSYSCYARGLEAISLVYPILDMVPKGRDEDALPAPMAWMRLRDSYPGE